MSHFNQNYTNLLICKNDSFYEHEEIFMITLGKPWYDILIQSNAKLTFGPGNPGGPGGPRGPY